MPSRRYSFLTGQMRYVLYPIFKKFAKELNTDEPFVIATNNKQYEWKIEVSQKGVHVFDMEVLSSRSALTGVSIISDGLRLAFMVTHPSAFDERIEIYFSDTYRGYSCYESSSKDFGKDLSANMRTEFFAYITIFALICQKLCGVVSVDSENQEVVKIIGSACQKMSEIVSLG